MRTTIKYFMMCMVCTFCFVGNVSAHEFVHPGTIFNQSDLDRMKAMVAAKKEPFYSAYQRMKADAYSNRGARGLFTQIPESQFNNIIGTDGRAALQKALIWKIEGIQSYAESAVAILNSYKNLKNCSSRGTGPLDNGKVYALIDAAELMRDYPGWKEADQQAFKNMLVYPGYSTTENYYNKYASNNDDNNGITFYWNIFNGDSGRHGNQGLFAMRSLISMAIFLDNETMYQRAIRKLKSMPHLEGDLPYPKGPKTPKDGGSLASNGNYYEYSNISTGSTVDTGYDDEIQYYFYENGQCQEQFRDQGHVIAGIMNMAVIMRTAWNQGEDLFNLDFGIGTENRMLKGLEYASRYNMSYLNKQEGYKYWSKDDKQAEVFEPTPVEDAGYNTVTDPEKFIKRLVRCARWKGVRSSADGRGAYLGEGMNDIYQMFKVQLGVPEDEMLWTTRMRQVNYELNDGHEKPYSSGHHYENLGWGDLTGERTPWMAGDGGKWVDGKFVLGLPTLPGTILASDYDNYVGMAMAGQKDGANGHTYYNDGTKSWKNYTVIMPTGGSYNISINVKSSKGGAKVTASTDDNNSTTSATIAATDGYEKVSLGLLAITSGAKVIRITVEGDIDDVDIQSFTVEKTKFRVLTMKVDKDYKYSTFVAPFDVKIPTGVTAYKVNCDGNKLILIKEAGESETLKADHPVVLYSEAGISKSFSGTGSVSDDDVTYGNLVGKYVKETGITDAQKYILFADASNPVGFYKTNDSSVDAYHAYLLLPETTAKDYFSFEEPSGIDEIKNAQSTMDDGQFNLQGIRVNNSYKGIIIKNGKKYISNQ